jgi:hypothetical protein
MEEDLDKIANGDRRAHYSGSQTFFYGHDDVPGLEYLAQDLGTYRRPTNQHHETR